VEVASARDDLAGLSFVLADEFGGAAVTTMK
jgi:hypothetical protein